MMTKKGHYNAQIMANSAIESLKLAFQENPDYKTSGLILAALAMVTQVREELSEITTDCRSCSPHEPCFPA